MLTIKNLIVEVGGKIVLNGLSLTIKQKELHVVMGPNGAGKTSLAMALAGNTNYKIENKKSKITIDGKDLTALLPEQRARNGLFVSFQQPVEVTGVSMLSFLRTAYKSLHPNENMPLSDFKQSIKTALTDVGLPESFMQRGINEGFSGGEKKRAEIVQLLVLKPSFVILDEIDSGLDVDSLKAVAKAISIAAKKYNLGILLITHYQRILHYLKPNFVHVLMDGKIKKSDGMALVRRIERSGYAAV